MARQGVARPGMARHGVAWQGDHMTTPTPPSCSTCRWWQRRPGTFSGICERMPGRERPVTEGGQECRWWAERRDQG